MNGGWQPEVEGKALGPSTSICPGTQVGSSSSGRVTRVVERRKKKKKKKKTYLG